MMDKEVQVASCVHHGSGCFKTVADRELAVTIFFIKLVNVTFILLVCNRWLGQLRKHGVRETTMVKGNTARDKLITLRADVTAHVTP